MRAKVRPLNVRGKPLFAKDAARQELYAGTLKVMENRLHRLGRTVTTATLCPHTADIPHPMLELYDVTLLWLEDQRLRLRGFEDLDGVQFAQTWDIEVD